MMWANIKHLTGTDSVRAYMVGEHLVPCCPTRKETADWKPTLPSHAFQLITSCIYACLHSGRSPIQNGPFALTPTCILQFMMLIMQLRNVQCRMRPCNQANTPE